MDVGTALEVLLARDLVSHDGSRRYRAGEIVQLRFKPDTDVLVVRRGKRLSEGLTVTLSEVVDSEIIRSGT